MRSERSDAEEDTLSPPHGVALAVGEQVGEALPLLQPHARLPPLQPAAAGDTWRGRTMYTYDKCPQSVISATMMKHSFLD